MSPWLSALLAALAAAVLTSALWLCHALVMLREYRDRWVSVEVELSAEKARLDWLEENDVFWASNGDGRVDWAAHEAGSAVIHMGDTVREAIDKAMSAAKGGGM